MDGLLNCSCVVVNYNDALTTIEFVKRIKNYNNIKHIIIVDNFSTDDSVELLQKEVDSKCEVLKMKKNGGYGYGNNAGIKYAYNKYGTYSVLIANPDTYIDEDVLTEMINILENDPSIAVIAPVQEDINGKVIEDYAWNIPSIKEYILMNTIFEKKERKDLVLRTKGDKTFVDCVPGALLLVNGYAFLKIGGFDEEMFLFCEETTIGYKVKNEGLKTALLLNKTYRHMHSASINKTIKSNLKKKKLIQESRIIFLRKYLKASTGQIIIAKIVFFISNIKTVIKGLVMRVSMCSHACN